MISEYGQKLFGFEINDDKLLIWETHVLYGISEWFSHDIF